MKGFDNAPIRRKLSVIIIGTAAAVLLLSLAGSLLVQIGAARNHATHHVDALARMMAANSRAILAFRDSDGADEILATLKTQQDVIWAAILLEDGEVFAGYRNSQPGARHTSTEPPAGATDNAVPSFDQILVEQPIMSGDRLLGYFQILGDSSHARKILFWQATVAIGIFVAAMGLALLLAQRLQRVFSAPVQNLLNVMRDVAGTRDFSHRAQRISNDELGKLADGFNDMLDQLGSYDHELATYRQDLEKQVRERTEQLERATEQAVAANNTKSEFLAAMSHEIRSPMTGVIGFTRLLEDSDLTPQQREYTSIIRNSAQSLLSVINEILDFSKMEVGKISLDRRGFAIDDLLGQIRAMMAPKARDKGITLFAACADDVPLTMYGDANRLRQILLNLLDNAIKFTNYGAVSIRIEVLSQHANQVTLQVRVRDTGIGISTRQQAQLFQPFQQADRTITRRYGGTGLGLVISQRLAQLMEGRIDVQSEIGKGSTFTVTVKLDLSETVAAEDRSGQSVAPRRDGVDLTGLRVLVVDDSPINLKLAVALLLGQDIEVTAVDSAKTAIQALLSAPFDLVLMDLEMPGTSGIDATQEIRSLANPVATIPVIAVTAHVFPEKREEVIQAGLNDLLAKPYMPEELFAIIGKWSGRSVATASCAAEREPADQSRVSDGGQAATADALLDDFAASLPGEAGMIRFAIADSDYATLYQIALRLAETTPAAGAMALQRAVHQLQQALEQQPRPRDRIESGVADVLQEIAQFQDHHRAPTADQTSS